MIIYAITNLVNGKRYIGLTEMTLGRRWTCHKDEAKRGTKTVLYNAIRKYGSKNFKVEAIASVLPQFGRDALSETERLVIAQEKTMVPAGYNVSPGGDGLAAGELNPNLGRKCSSEHITKCKAAWTPERRAAMSRIRAERNRRMNQTPEHKEKLKAAWQRAGSARREKAAKTLAAINQRPERKEAMAENIDRIRNAPGYRERLSEAVRDWWADRRQANAC